MPEPTDAPGATRNHRLLPLALGVCLLGAAGCSSSPGDASTVLRVATRDPASVDIVLTIDGTTELLTADLAAGGSWRREIPLDGSFDIELEATATGGGPITCDSTEPGWEPGESSGAADWSMVVRCAVRGEVDADAVSWEVRTGADPYEEAEPTTGPRSDDWCAQFSRQRVDVAIGWAEDRRALETEDLLDDRLAFLERNLADNDCDEVAADAVLCAGLSEATASDANLDVWLGGVSRRWRAGVSCSCSTSTITTCSS